MEVTILLQIDALHFPVEELLCCELQLLIATLHLRHNISLQLQQPFRECRKDNDLILPPLGNQVLQQGVDVLGDILLEGLELHPSGTEVVLQGLVGLEQRLALQLFLLEEGLVFVQTVLEEDL